MCHKSLEMSKTGYFQDFDIGVLQKKERGASVRGADPGNTGPPENM